MTADASILHSIADQKPVKVFLPIQGKAEMQRVHCIFEHTLIPQFNLRFVAGDLPEKIDENKGVIVSVDIGGRMTSIEAMITSVVDNQTLELAVQKSITHAQMREFFRVDTATRVISKSFNTEEGSESWQITGESIDISGSGILATFSSKIPESRYIALEITLPESDGDEDETVEIIAHQVRTIALDDGRYQVAFHFDRISDEDRDKIIGCCLVLQRKMLRLRVRVHEEFEE